MSREINDKALEYYRCKKNPLYCIDNYVKIPEIGGEMDYKLSVVNPKLIRVVKVFFKFHKLIFMATRQHGKSTVAAMILEYCCNFFPGNRAIILNFRQSAAYENLEKIKFIHSRFPKFLRSELKNKGSRKTYIEYANGSRIDIFYPSTTSTASNIARSLTAPILYIDEVSTIHDIEDAYSGAQPVLSKAREQAKANNYPYGIMMTATPNGVEGDGAFFHSFWNNSVDSNDLYELDDDGQERLTLDHQQYVDNPVKNSFVNIKYHWSESGRTQEWYLEQCRELNFNTRKINQELDLIFRGSTNCIFDDEFISALKPKSAIMKVKLPHMTFLNVFCEFNPCDFYYVGIDTARSLIGDYCAIEIFSHSDFIQVAEFHGRLGSITKFTEIVIELTKILISVVGSKFMLCPENNVGVGSNLIENLLNYEELDFRDFLFIEKEIKQKDGKIREKKLEGVNTNGKTKDQMVSMFYDLIYESPHSVSSTDLISQFSIIERKANGTVSAQKGSHDDLFMACCLAAYGRQKSMLEVESSIGKKSNANIASTSLDKQLISNVFSDSLVVVSRTQQFPPDIYREIITDSKIKSKNISNEKDDDFFDVLIL